MNSDQSDKSNATVDQSKTCEESLDEKLKVLYQRIEEFNNKNAIDKEKMIKTVDKVNHVLSLLSVSINDVASTSRECLPMNGQVQLEIPEVQVSNPQTGSVTTNYSNDLNDQIGVKDMPIVINSVAQNSEYLPMDGQVQLEVPEVSNPQTGSMTNNYSNDLNDQIGVKDMPIVINSVAHNSEYLQMDGQVQLENPEVLNPYTGEVNVYSNDQNSQIGFNDVPKSINSVSHDFVSENSSLVTSHEPQNFRSEMNMINFQSAINSYSTSITLQNSHFQTNCTEKSKEISQSINSLHNCCSFKICNDVNDFAKLAEITLNEKKRRFYKNKYNYLKIVKVSNLNNATVNAQVDHETGERITIPDHYFKTYRRPIRLLQPVIKLKKFDA